MAVFGPSGAGKSTLLRLIAGFLRPDAGRICFGETLWCDTERRIFTSPHQRRVGTVFQDGRLFPHLNVEQNLHYADRRSHMNGERYDFSDIVDAFDLSGLLPRAPDTLSGGERQRVALARTLLTRPDLLLLDEPLSALDRRRKAEIIPYLDDLAGRFGAPVIYVSHNLEEIVRLARRTAIMTAGRIDAEGPTAEVLNAYGVGPDADAFAPGAVLEAVVADHDEKRLLTHVSVGEGVLSLPINKHKPVGDAVNIRIDARNVAIATAPPTGLSIRNALPATIAAIKAEGNSPFTIVELMSSGALLRAQVTKAAVEELGLEQGQAVFALVKAASFDF